MARSRIKPRAALSRQRLWQLDRVARGLCAVCGDPRQQYAQLCNACQAKHRAYQRRLYDAQTPRAPYGPRRKKTRHTRRGDV